MPAGETTGKTDPLTLSSLRHRLPPFSGEIMLPNHAGELQSSGSSNKKDGPKWPFTAEHPMTGSFMRIADLSISKRRFYIQALGHHLLAN